MLKLKFVIRNLLNEWDILIEIVLLLGKRRGVEIYEKLVKCLVFVSLEVMLLNSVLLLFFIKIVLVVIWYFKVELVLVIFLKF